MSVLSKALQDWIKKEPGLGKNLETLKLDDRVNFFPNKSLSETDKKELEQFKEL